jgi:hypothetical protein
MSIYDIDRKRPNCAGTLSFNAYFWVLRYEFLLELRSPGEPDRTTGR